MQKDLSKYNELRNGRVEDDYPDNVRQSPNFASANRRSSERRIIQTDL